MNQMDYSKCAEALDFLHLYHAHAETADIEKYFDCFAINGRFLGTDSTECWTIEEFKRYSEPFFSDKHTAPFTLVEGSRKFTSFPMNSLTPIVVAFDEILECKGVTNAQARGTGSLIWNHEKNKWVIFLYHLSIPVPNDIARQVCSLTQSISLSTT